MKILVIKLSSLGDIVHTIPAVNLIKNSIPDVHIDWLCYKKFSALLNTQYSINETISLEDKQLSSTFDIVNKLKAFKYDYVLDFQGLIKTAFMASQISGQSVGFKKPRETLAARLYKHKFDVGEILDNSTHIIDKNISFVSQFLGSLDIDLVPGIDFGGLNKAKQIQKDKIKNICIIPGTTWESKFWLAENWAQVMKALREKYDANINITGTNSDLVVIEDILLHYKDPLSLIINRSFEELIDFYTEMDLIIGVDTGPLHIAAAVNYNSNTKIIGLYGPTAAQRSGPYGFPSLSVDQLFHKEPSHKRTIEEDGNSMYNISTKMVLDFVENY